MVKAFFNGIGLEGNDGDFTLKIADDIFLKTAAKDQIWLQIFYSLNRGICKAANDNFCCCDRVQGRVIRYTDKGSVNANTNKYFCD